MHNYTLKKKIVFSLILVAILIICVVVIGEMIARLWGPEGKYNKPKRTSSDVPIRERSEELHHNLIPGVRAVMFRGEENLTPIPFEVNSSGIRGPEMREKRFGEMRILILGDSFIEDRLNKFEETIGQLLQKKVADKNIDVIQHGVSSWSPLTELNWYLKVGYKLKPDVVILFLVLNDFYCAESSARAAYQKECILDESGYPIRFAFKKAIPKASIEDRLEQNKSESFAETLVEKSCFLKWICMTIKRFAEKTLTQRQLNMLMKVPATEFDQITEKLFANTREHKTKKDIIRLTRPEKLWDKKTKKVVNEALANVNRLEKVIKKEGGMLIVTLIPLGWNFRNENIGGKIAYQFARHLQIPMGGIAQKLKEFCGKNNIQYIDLYSAFEHWKENHSAKLYFNLDGHWNANGNKVVADILYEKVVRDACIEE